MNKRLPVALAACTLLLSACSSSGSSTDGAFCDSIQEWSDVLTEGGTTMDDLGNSMMVSDPADYPSPDELHAFGEEILSAADQADAAMDTAVANTSDDDVAAILAEGNDLLIGMFRWMGEAAVEAQDIEDFAAIIYADIDTISDAEERFNELDADKVDSYILDECPDVTFDFDEN